jgi:tRNA-2-methylthio-N6-dimethylallyladenosine synthase
MRREYTREEYLRKVEMVRACKRPLAMTTDIIVGFPGETNEDFIQTMDLLHQVRYTGVFSFKYSPRPNTAAIEMEDAIPEEVKSERLMILQRRQQELQQIDNQAWVGRTIEVMVEGHNDKLGQWAGRSTTNRVVNFTGSGLLLDEAGAASNGLAVFNRTLQPGDYVPVRIIRAGANSFVGEQAAASALQAQAVQA